MQTAKGMPEEILRFIEIAVEQAVERAIGAGKRQAQDEVKETYRATEKRLHRYPVLVDRVADNKDRLQDMIENGKPSHGTSLVRFSRTGTRLKPEDVLDALIQDMEASIAADEYEIAAIEKALRTIEGDQYYLVISGRFIENRTDEEIAEALFCDPSTVRRNRGRLIRKLAVWLYGASA